ncbi:hypothetical protein [Actinomadura sp. 6N118]
MRDLPEQLISEVRAALLEHKVLAYRIEGDDASHNTPAVSAV